MAKKISEMDLDEVLAEAKRQAHYYHNAILDKCLERLMSHGVEIAEFATIEDVAAIPKERPAIPEIEILESCMRYHLAYPARNCRIVGDGQEKK